MMRLRVVCGVTIICSVMSVAVSGVDAFDRYWPRHPAIINFRMNCHFEIVASDGSVPRPTMDGSPRYFWWITRPDGTCHGEDSAELMKEAAIYYRMWGSGI